MDEIKETSSYTRKKLSRRDFLKIASASVLSAPFALEALKRGFIEAIKKAITSNSGLNETTNQALYKAIEQVSKEKNPNYRPMQTLVSEAISSYQTKTGNKAYYSKDSSFKPREEYKKTLDELQKIPFWNLRSNDFALAFIESFDNRQQAVYNASFNFSLGIQSAAVPGSGYYRMLKSEFGDSLDENLTQVSDTKSYSDIESSLLQDMQATREYVEKILKDKQSPIASSKILEHFLLKNEGNISESMFDSAIFLKFMTRNDIDNRGRFVGDDPESIKNITWMKANILDEFDGPSYSQIDSHDKSMLNLIGKPYHSWFLVSLLKFFPSSVIGSGTLYELFKHIDEHGEHGLGKVKADIKTLTELDNLEEYLDKFKEH